MSIIDLLFILLLLIAAWHGWRQGFVTQVCTLAGIFAGIYLAATYGGDIGKLLGLDPAVAQPGGFIAVLVITLLAVAIVARLLRGVFHFAGFGLPDSLLGVATSVFKYLLVIGALLSAFDTINTDYHIISHQKIRQSKCYVPVKNFSERVFPLMKWVGEQFPLQKDKD